MNHRFLLIIGTLLFAACTPTNPNPMGNGSMMGDNQVGMMDSTGSPRVQKSFLPAEGKGINTLLPAKKSEIIEIEDGDTITLNPEIVRAKLNGKSFAMYGYNGQIPGPVLKVKQGSTFTVNVTNNIDQPTTVHWHGIRLANANDGVPGLTQEAIEPRGSFTYTVTVPDEGMFWYHPHVREDLQQDLGLYGNLWVTPKDALAYSTVDHEEVLILDDILLEGGLPVPYGSEEASHALMGRFGNTMLINGQTDYELPVVRGSTVRFYLTNAANTRTFNLRFGDAKIKLIGSDAGRKERSEFVDSVILSPSERAIIEVQFRDAQTYQIKSVSPEKSWLLGTVTAGSGTSSDQDSFASLDKYADVEADINAFRSYFDKPIDKTIHLYVESMMAEMMMQGNNGGMQHGMGHGSNTAEDESGMDSTISPQVEWEDPMPHMNAMSIKGNTEWKLIDEASKQKNMDIDYKFKVGDKVKIRIVNDDENSGSDHPMQHPIHFHGQRFLVLAVDGKHQTNLAWKDTVLVENSQTVDILLDVTNPGDWMFHCHIAEHLSNGMMGMFKVLPQ